MSQLTPEDFQVWGKQKSSAKFDKPAGCSGSIGGYDPNRKPETQAKPKANTTNEAEEAPVVQKKQDDSCYAKVRLKSIELVAGEAGVFEFNKKCKAKGSVEILQDSATKRATVTLVCRYKGTEHEIEKKDAAISNNAFEIELSLFYADPFYDDYAKDKSITCEYVAKLLHSQTTTVISSTLLTMPRQKKKVVLKKGMHDENVQKEKSGNDYVAGSDIKTLQTNLNAMNFDCGTPGGGFGPKTEAAVKLFQKYAKENRRLKKGASAYETVTAVLQGEIDGVVGDRTAAEIREWIDKKYVKPVLPIRQGDYDDEGVKKGKGAKDGDDHLKGTDVTAAQQLLLKIGAYKGAIDGWFGPKMKSAVELFQEYAERGEFLIKGKLTDTGEKLTGQRKGILDASAQEIAQKVAKMDGMVGKEENDNNGESKYEITYSGDITPISDKAVEALKTIMKEANVFSVTITSTVRTPADQARIMYNNIESYGVDQQKKLYGTNSDMVIDVYSKLKKDKKNAAEIKKSMEDKIVELGSTTISKHCCDPAKMSIFDIGPSSIPDDKKTAFSNAIKSCKSLSKFILPPTDPAYHLEVTL